MLWCIKASIAVEGAVCIGSHIDLVGVRAGTAGGRRLTGLGGPRFFACSETLFHSIHDVCRGQAVATHDGGFRYGYFDEQFRFAARKICRLPVDKAGRDPG